MYRTRVRLLIDRGFDLRHYPRVRIKHGIRTGETGAVTFSLFRHPQNNYSSVNGKLSTKFYY